MSPLRAPICVLIAFLLQLSLVQQEQFFPDAARPYKDTKSATNENVQVLTGE